MEEKARELGIGKTLFYMFPQNTFLNATDIKKAAALTPRVDSQMLADLHVGAGGAVSAAEGLFQSANLTSAGLQIGAVNAETNANTHTFVRAMTEAADLNDWFNAQIASADTDSNRLHFRAASFCMASSNDFDNFDQGLSFFLPNASFLQPPGLVHMMIDQTWQPNALKVETSAGWNSGGTQPGLHPPKSLFSAQTSADGNTLVLRYVNFHQSTHDVIPQLAPATTIKVHLIGSMAAAEFNATMWTLASADPERGNTPGQPTRVAPKKSLLPVLRNGTVLNIPANAYVVVVATLL